VQVANAPPGLQACSFNIKSFYRTCPVAPDHKPWLVQRTKGDFYIDHTHSFGVSLVSSNAGMIGNTIVDIQWVAEGIGPIAKYEDDFSVY